MRVQPFQNELRRRSPHRIRLVLGQAQRARLLHQPLDAVQLPHHLRRANILAQFQLPAQIEPLHHRAHIHAFEVAVENLPHSHPDQLPATASPPFSSPSYSSPILPVIAGSAA